MMRQSLKKIRRLLDRGKGQRVADQSYQERLENEQAVYADYLNVHDLPDVFHYWSNRYLVPMYSPFGFANPIDFFFNAVSSQCERTPDRVVQVASIGSGNGDLETQIASDLLNRGLRNFRIEGLEINQHMIGRGQEQAQQAGVSSHLTFTRQDFNQWRPGADSLDVVMASQSLHHVLELEHLFTGIHQGLRANGRFVTVDTIGRNGHQRWPEALELVNRYWQELPTAYRYNQLMRRQEDEHINHDCSTEGFEGIRAQDILPLLVQTFEFELFVPYSNVVSTFIDRPFGHNFDAEAEWDRNFIDRLHQADEEGFQNGSLKPTQMVASMSLSGGNPQLRHPRLTPAFCVRPVD